MSTGAKFAQVFANEAGVPLRKTGRLNFTTRRFVKTFQGAYCRGLYESEPLKVDGIPGPLTCRAMNDSKDHGFRLSANFKMKEFITKGERRVTLSNEVLKVDRQLVLSLEYLRKTIGSPIYILSAYRDPVHNKRIGGASRSQHLYGKAVDVDRALTKRPITEAEARAAGFNGVGMLARSRPGQDVIHVDVRHAAARWFYR